MSIDPRRVKELFVAALDLPDAQAREDFLQRECGGDAELRQRLDVLLKAHDEPASVLSKPLAGAKPDADPAQTSDYADSVEQLGTIVAGRYKLLEQIGEGGMGSVYMAEQTQPVKRMVAFKVIKAGMDSKQILARFESERQALALMDHPNIAKVLDAGATERGHPFFVMELVKGVPLTPFCDNRQLSVGDRLKIFQQICHAVQHAHQKGIIHRDLKPGNILVESHDGKPVPKIIDFGLAKAMNALPLTERSLFTHFGTILGTPLYMAPEQAEASAIDVDTRADIYALGVILYELLTGTTPLEKKRLAQAAWEEIRRVIKEEEPQTPSARLSSSERRASIAAQRQSEPGKLGRFVRGDLDWIVMKALAKERDRRYDTANAFAADVERFLNNEPVSAGPPTAAYKLRKFLHRHRGRVTAAAVLLFALLAGAVVSTWQAVRATRAESETAQALLVAEQNEEEAIQQRHKADELRKIAEKQTASIAMDMDLKYCEDGEIAFGLLRLAETLRTIPEHAKELRECAALSILAWGQRFRPAWALEHDGFAVTEAKLSPDGLSVLSLGRDGTARLWDSLTGKQRAILGQPPQQLKDAPSGLIQFSQDGSTALTLHGKGSSSTIDGRTLFVMSYINGSDGIVRLWDTGTGQLRATTTKNPGNFFEVRLSQNNSLLVTACSRVDISPNTSIQYTVFFWNARTGQLIRKLDLRGSDASIDVSPDAKSVLIAQDGQFCVWSPEADRPLKRLTGDRVVFSPRGGSAVSIANGVVYWWNTADWQLRRTIDLSSQLDNRLTVTNPSFLDEDMLRVELSDSYGYEQGLIFVRSLPQPIREPIRVDLSPPPRSEVSPNGRLLLAGNLVYNTLDGQRLPLPHGRKFHPELKQLTQDGRFTSLFRSTIVDLATDKVIRLEKGTGNSGGRFLKDCETWTVLDAEMRLFALRKADAALDAELLRQWCQVLARGKLDENDQFTKLDEPAWEKARQELAQLLDSNPQALSLRSATTDRLYWLRQEIKDVESFKDHAATLVLLDRLIHAEPTWPNYSQRAAFHAKLQHWDLAMRDELEAARLTGERYWLGGSPISDRTLAARSVQAPGRPREQYERALRWVEARIRAGVSDQPRPIGEYEPEQDVIAGLALFRLGRYADALAKLQRRDVPMFSEATGMMMSRWNLLTMMTYGSELGPREGEVIIREYFFNPVDLLVRAMCHHHLGHPKEAKVCLQQARGMLGKDEKAINADQRAFLREAESLIEGKQRP